MFLCIILLPLSICFYLSFYIKGVGLQGMPESISIMILIQTLSTRLDL
jgi:hypothetical protein